MEHGYQMPAWERVTYLWVTVFGATGTNGLNGLSKQQAQDIQALGDRVRRIEMIEAQVALAWKILQWVALTVATTIGFLISGPLAGVLAKMLRAGLD